ncbi:MAG: gliding motility-associated C-terminal domain-containing protein [Saprospiraceae bacterium]|nr:gliding motility-associated C-terminal domain-containing protein [Saprospiraceae bacterium]
MLKRLLSLICILGAFQSAIHAQCTPPMAESCEEANVLCSLDEVNGYACNNPSSVPSPCSPLCSQGGVGHNTSWWGFVTQGGNVTITLTIGGCTTSQGLQYGVWGDCNCSQEVACRSIPCVPPGSVEIINANLEPCKTYYLWVDGCSGDICDFTLSTSGGGPPTLSPLGFINNKPSMIIEPICVGACNVRFWVNPQPGGCNPTYVWTLDGDEVGGNSNEINLDFPDEGDFVICVTAYIGNPQSGSICSQEGPKCATVKVRPIADKMGIPRVVCYEQANPGGFKWHSQRIFTSGEYRQQFTDANCCKFDSVVNFTVLDEPEPAEVYYITCDNEPYIDILGKAWQPCTQAFQVPLAKTTDPYKCDSSILLTAINVDYRPNFRVTCFGGMVEISPNIIMVKPCNVGETYQFDYRWYKCNDPQKKTISTDERILVDAVSETYCLEVNVRVELGTEFAVCAKTFQENFNEGDLAPKCFPLAGDLILCTGFNGTYFIDTFISQKVLFYSWTVDGGTIVSKIDSQAVEIKWNLNAGDTGEVCVFYDTDCGRSCEKCLRVAIVGTPRPDAGPNDSICDLANQFQGRRDVGGGSWTVLSGPGNSNIADITDPASAVSVDKYGMYKYVYSETRLGCTGTDTVDMFFNSTPDSSNVVYICNVQQTQYRLRFKINGGTAPYTVIQGNGVVDANGFYTSNFHDNLTNYTIVIRDVMGCILTFNFNHECKCTNAVGLLEKAPEELCEDESFNFFYDPSTEIQDPNDTVMFVITDDPDPNNVAGGTFIKKLSSNNVVFDPATMSFNTTYYVFVILGKRDGLGGIDYAAGCVQPDGPKPFVFYQNPTPTAGTDNAICNTVYDLQGTQSIGGTNLKWRLISGPSGVVFADDAAASTSVNTQGNFGTYVFEFTEDNNNCLGADRVSITFNESPLITVDEKICIDYNDPNYPYAAKVKINTGQPPYTILAGGGTINGNIYMTDTLASLVQFSVQIQDANGCVSNLIIDNYNCNCGNINAGLLDSLPTELCVDQCIGIRELVPAILDPEDNAMYILHQSSYNDQVIPRLDTFFSLNDQICFNASTMVTGKTYFLTRVVGNDTMPIDLIVDSNDPCLRASNNQPIVWYDYPNPDAGPHDSICFYDYQLNGTTNTGTPSWRVIGGPGVSIISNPSNDQTSVTVSSIGTYRYELTEDFKNCITKDTVDITHWDSPNFVDVPPPYECDNTAEKYRVRIDGQNGERISWTIDGVSFPGGNLPGSFIGANTWQTDWIDNNSTYTLIINDRHNCLPDTTSNTYECPCISGLGNLDQTPIILCADGTAQANYNAASGNPDGNDVIRFALYDGNQNDPRNGSILSFNSNGSFTFDAGTMQLGKTYYIAVFMGNLDPATGNVVLTDRCLKAAAVPVTWYAYPVAAISGPAILTCAVTSITLDGSSSTSGSGANLNYAWSTANGQFVNPGQVNGGTVDINKEGTYTLLVTDPVTNCTHQITYNITLNVVKPTVNIGNPELITCDRLTVGLDGNASSKGPNYIVNWSGPGNIQNGSSYNPTVDATGTYTMLITNTTNGCQELATINVAEDKRKPTPNISQIGQLTCTVKQIQLDASGSTGQAGPISAFNWATANGSIVSGLGTPRITIDRPGTYSVLVKDQTNGCTELTDITVSEIGNPLAGFDLNAGNPKCHGERNGNIDITGVIATGPANGLTYSFNNGPFTTNRSYPNLGEGSYKLVVRDVNGCEHDTTLTLIEPGQLGIGVDKLIVVDQDEIVYLDTMLNYVSGGTAAYRDTNWLNLNQNVPWDTKLRYAADTTRDFLVTVIDAAGCEIQERITVVVRIIKDIWWPNVFSPNGDGINELWNLKGKRVTKIKTLNIYDRWGELVYSGQDLLDGNIDNKVGWDGNLKGKKALPGVYVFYAEIQFYGSLGFDKYKGEFTLLR